MTQPFGVVKPADKNEKQDKKKKAEKKPRHADGKGNHRPFQAEMQKIQDEERRVKEAAKVEHQKKKEDEKRKAQQAEQAAKYGDIWKYADEKKTQHDLPEDFYQKLKAAPNKGAAKKLVRDFLQERDRLAALASLPAGG